MQTFSSYTESIIYMRIIYTDICCNTPPVAYGSQFKEKVCIVTGADTIYLIVCKAYVNYNINSTLNFFMITSRDNGVEAREGTISFAWQFFYWVFFL